MRPVARVQATIEALASIFEIAKPADSVLSTFFRSRRYIGSKDRVAIAEQVYAILRHYARLCWWIEREKGRQDARTLTLAWIMLGENVHYDTLAGICSGGQFAPATLATDEKEFFQRLNGRTLNHPHMPELTQLECPEWAAAGLKKRFGADFGYEVRALLDAAPLDVRVNTLKIDRATAQAALQKEGIKCTPTPLSPLGLRIEGRPALAATTVFQEGLVEIQDEGSQLVAGLVDAHPGHQVVDFCAGAGGKTLAIAAGMKGKGRVIACDVLERRLTRAALRFRRAGLYNIETRPLSTERDPWVKRHKGKFDRVLVDAPCSGVGVWRRNPDARWKHLGPGLEELVPLQASILDSAARLVKTGGKLVYATCSMLFEENDFQIKSFLETHKDFKILPCGLDGADFLTLTPARHNTDGFFGAVLERLAPATPEGVEETTTQTD